MRAAIARTSRESYVIRAAFIEADGQGLSGEDRYVLLAYHALRALEDTSQSLTKMMACMPTSDL